MSGYVGQIKGLGHDPNGIQFLLSRETGREKIFASREAARKHLHDKEHMADDDLRFVFWFEEGEDKKRSILTGELIDPVELSEEDGFEEELDNDELDEDEDDFINDEELEANDG